MKTFFISILGFILLISLLILIYKTEKVDKTEKSHEEKITYFKDNRTGLCFASITTTPMFTMSSITCVPCDSLKNVEVEVKYLTKF